MNSYLFDGGVVACKLVVGRGVVVVVVVVVGLGVVVVVVVVVVVGWVVGLHCGGQLHGEQGHLIKKKSKKSTRFWGFKKDVPWHTRIALTRTSLRCCCL